MSNCPLNYLCLLPWSGISLKPSSEKPHCSEQKWMQGLRPAKLLRKSDGQGIITKQIIDTTPPKVREHWRRKGRKSKEQKNWEHGAKCVLIESKADRQSSNGPPSDSTLLTPAVAHSNEEP